jgi:hypothetical protein
MKKMLIILLLMSVTIISKTSAQDVIVNGSTTYTNSGTGTGIPFDFGINYYFYANPFPTPSGGGEQYLFRNGNYWYFAFRGIGIPFNSNRYLVARTVLQHPTSLPPDCALWQRYIPNTIVPNGELWTGYPNTAPTIPTGTFVTYALTGDVFSGGSSTSTTILPEYIDLSTKSSTTFGTYTNTPGRLLFDICDNSMKYNNGTNWKAVWPNLLNYTLNLNQSFDFVNNTTQIIGIKPTSLPTQLSFITNSKTRIILEKDNVTNFSNINLKSSIGVGYTSKTTSYTIADDDYVVIFTGGTSQTFTLPNPSLSLGRTLILVNTSPNNLALSPAITGLGLTLNTGQNATILSIDTSWIKIN